MSVQSEKPLMPTVLIWTSISVELIGNGLLIRCDVEESALQDALQIFRSSNSEIENVKVKSNTNTNGKKKQRFLTTHPAPIEMTIKQLERRSIRLIPTLELCVPSFQSTNGIVLQVSEEASAAIKMQSVSRRHLASRRVASQRKIKTVSGQTRIENRKARKTALAKMARKGKQIDLSKFDAAKRIQAQSRGRTARRRVIEMKENQTRQLSVQRDGFGGAPRILNDPSGASITEKGAVTMIAAQYRKNVATEEVAIKREIFQSARMIQNKHRSNKAKQIVQQKRSERDSATMLQTKARQRKAMKEFNEAKTSAIRLESMARTRQAQKEFRKAKKSATVLQSNARTRIAQKSFHKSIHASVKIQTKARQRQALKQVEEIKREKQREEAKELEKKQEEEEDEVKVAPHDFWGQQEILQKKKREAKRSEPEKEEKPTEHRSKDHHNSTFDKTKHAIGDALSGGALFHHSHASSSKSAEKEKTKDHHNSTFDKTKHAIGDALSGGALFHHSHASSSKNAEKEKTKDHHNSTFDKTKHAIGDALSGGALFHHSHSSSSKDAEKE